MPSFAFQAVSFSPNDDRYLTMFTEVEVRTPPPKPKRLATVDLPPCDEHADTSRPRAPLRRAHTTGESDAPH